MKDSFIIKFQKLVEKTDLEHIDIIKIGHRYEKIVYTTPPTSSITEFINHWIKNGKSFIDLDRWCLNQGI